MRSESPPPSTFAHRLSVITPVQGVVGPNGDCVPRRVGERGRVWQARHPTIGVVYSVVRKQLPGQHHRDTEAMPAAKEGTGPQCDCAVERWLAGMRCKYAVGPQAQ